VNGAAKSTQKPGQSGILEEEPEEELVEDMISIVTSSSARLYGKRGGRVAKKSSDILAEEEVATGEDHGDGCDS
jgi:predicted site-specific integrase-resolvase